MTSVFSPAQTGPIRLRLQGALRPQLHWQWFEAFLCLKFLLLERRQKWPEQADGFLRHFLTLRLWPPVVREGLGHLPNSRDSTAQRTPVNV